MMFSFINLLLMPLTASSYPYPERDQLQAFDKPATPASTAVTSSNMSTNLLLNAPTSPTSNAISCYIPTPAIRPILTTSRDCRIIFREISNLPFYHETQEFREGVMPRLDHVETPPFLFSNDTPEVDNCAVFLSASNPADTDKFSWEEVRGVGQAIMRTCGSPGFGGRCAIGRERGWVVRVYGYRRQAGVARSGGIAGDRPPDVFDSTLESLIA